MFSHNHLQKIVVTQILTQFSHIINIIIYELKNNFHHQDNHLDIPFNENELFNTMSNCKSKGTDYIPHSFFQNLPSNGKIQLLKIYNIIWNNGVFPDQWRNAIFIHIPKPNKNKFYIANYRPILFINTMGKIIEKIVNKRLI